MLKRPIFDMEKSGLKMKKIREERNFSVRQVVEYMGFESTQAIYKWEAGKCFPQADNLIALALLYKVNPNELFVEEGEDTSSFYFIRKIKKTFAGYGQMFLYKQISL